MKRILALGLAIAPVFMAGCGNGDAADMKTDPKTVMNPTGNVANLPPQAQGMAEQQQKAGESASKNMDEMSRQMREAQARAGGK